MANYKVLMHYSNGIDEEDDTIFDSEEEAYNYGVYLCGCSVQGAEILNLSNPGDYPLDDDYDDETDFEVIKVD